MRRRQRQASWRNAKKKESVAAEAAEKTIIIHTGVSAA